jgi:hypothetical protein
MRVTTRASGSGAAAARVLLDDPPKLHDWGRGPEVGGLDRRIGERMIREVTQYEAARIVETGAGVSSLLFLCLEPRALTSIEYDATLRDRMLAAASERGIPVDRLRFMCEHSEFALPRLAMNGERFDVGLIDGCHNWPTVFADFCYVNYMLPPGGTLFLDDVQLYSVLQLYQLLREGEEYEHIALDGKLATFRKVLDRPWLPEWRSQPYIERNTVTLPPS